MADRVRRRHTNAGGHREQSIMKVALVNPNWTFDGGIYFGCREPHLPLEYGYSRRLLEREGHAVRLVDAQLHDWTLDEVRRQVEAFNPDHIVMTTAPSYLFWRCAPPELRVPQETLRALEGIAATRIIVGPHASTTPGTTLRKLHADVAVLGECEDILPRLAAGREAWPSISSIAWIDEGRVTVQGGVHQTDMAALPALHWSAEDVGRHRHHHHRFDKQPDRPGGEMEVSRGCPYHCTFCAKDNFRNDYRKRPLPVILEEIDGLIANGVEYIYFIDEIFLPNKALLDALVGRPVVFGIQTRIDLWNTPLLDLLGQAGCVSIEAGIESITVEGRNLLEKGSRLTTEQLAERLIHAKTSVPFVQANLLESGTDDPADVEAWRQRLHAEGVWANKPVPMFPYPGSPGYTRRWGAPDDSAWERAMDFYLAQFDEFSDIQDARPRPLSQLELQGAHTR
jgi:anaerobic magnesium-protoporphyrin IX monomethyl ester cyclase